MKIKNKIKKFIIGENPILKILNSILLLNLINSIIYGNKYDLTYSDKISSILSILIIIASFMLMCLLEKKITKFENFVEYSTIFLFIANSLFWINYVKKIDFIALLIIILSLYIKLIIEKRKSLKIKKFFKLLKKRKFLPTIIIFLDLFMIKYFFTNKIIKNRYDLFFLLFVVLLANFEIFKNRIKDVKLTNFKMNERKRKILIATALILIFLLNFSLISIKCYLRYKMYGNSTFDTGIINNNFYNMVKYFIPYSTCERNTWLSHFNVHISFIYYLVFPIYYLFSSPITIAMLPGLIISSSIFPLYLICKHKNISSKKSILICLLFSINTSVLCCTNFDLHENHFLIPLFFWLFYSYESKKNIKFILFSILILICKEDAAIYLIMFGLYMIFDNNKKKGMLTIIFSILYFFLAIHYLSTYGDGVMVNRYSNLIPNNYGMLGALKTLLFNLGYTLNQLVVSENYKKIIFYVQMLLPLGLMPLCVKKPKNYVLLFPLILISLTTYPYSFNIDFHYTCASISFLFYLFILNISDYKNYSYLLICFICTIIMFVNCYLSPTKLTLKTYKENKMTYYMMDKVLEKVNEKRNVIASAFLVPHLSNRDIIYDSYYYYDLSDEEIDCIVLDIGYEPDFEEKYKKAIENNFIETTRMLDKIVILERNN